MAGANSVGRKFPVSGVGNLRKSRGGEHAERREKKNLDFDFTDCDDNTGLAICSQISPDHRKGALLAGSHVL